MDKNIHEGMFVCYFHYQLDRHEAEEQKYHATSSKYMLMNLYSRQGLNQMLANVYLGL